MSKEDKSVKPKRSNPLLPHEAKELKKVSDYAAKKEAEVKNKSDKFSDTESYMRSLRLLWDAKVPDKDRKPYHFFTFSSSNPADVLKEIHAYQNFYKELKKVIDKVSNPEEPTDSNHIKSYELILELDDKLSSMLDAAKLGKNATASSAVYDLHKSFIQKHKELENMIKRAECVALKDGLKKATDGWQASIESVNKLEAKLEKFDRMSDMFDRLVLQNEMLLRQQNTLLESNKKMEQQQESLLKKIAEYENNKK